MTGDPVDRNLREAVFLLVNAAEQFIAARALGRPMTYADLPADAPTEVFLEDFIASMGELWSDVRVTRYDLELIFHNAEIATGENDGPIGPVTKFIYAAWDRFLEMIPSPSYEDMEGSAVGVSGD